MFIQDHKCDNWCFLQARVMFDGEMASLIAIAATNTVRVPKPIQVLNNPKGGSSIVLEYLEMKGMKNYENMFILSVYVWLYSIRYFFSGLRKYSKRLGHELAKLHQHNINLGLQARKLENTVTKPPQVKDADEVSPEDSGQPTYVTQFGFHTNTCCGFIPQENAWSDDWLVRYVKNI